MKYSQIVVNFPVVSGLNVVKTLKNALLFTTMPVGFLTASPRVTFDDGAVVVVIVGLKWITNYTRRTISFTCNDAFTDSDGLMSVWYIIVLSHKNIPAKDPAHTAEITIPAINRAAPAIKIM